MGDRSGATGVDAAEVEPGSAAGGAAVALATAALGGGGAISAGAGGVADGRAASSTDGRGAAAGAAAAAAAAARWVGVGLAETVSGTRGRVDGEAAGRDGADVAGADARG